MFPRAARFSQRKLSDTPGPNAYDPTEMMAHYKKGLLNQTDSRFKSNSNLNDDQPSTSAAGLASTTTAPPASSAIMESVGAKEKAKLMAKLAKAEEKAADLERQNHSLSNEKNQKVADLRRSQQQVDKLQAQISKTRGQQTSKIETSQAKFTDLTKAHEQATAKHKAEMERWEAKCSKLQSEKEEAEARLQEARSIVTSTEGYVQTMRGSESSLRQQLEGERERRKQLEEELSDALQGCEVQENTVEKLLSEKWQQMDRIEDLEKFKESTEESFYELDRQRGALLSVALSSRQQITDLEEQLRQSQREVSIADMIIRRLRVQLSDMKHDNRLHLDSIATLENSLREEQRDHSETQASLDDTLKQQAQYSAHDHEDGLAYHGPSSLSKAEVLLEINNTLHSLAESDLKEQKRMNSRLNTEIDELHERYLHSLRKNATIQSSQHAIDKIRQELESVEEAYDKTVLELLRAHKSEEEAKREISNLKTENQGLTSRVKHFEQLSKKVFHAKVKEEAWIQEREELLQELGRLSHFEGEYNSLRSQAQILLSRSTSYEAQMEELKNFNIMLASHSNPSQKIVYLDRVRRELDDKRMECQLLHTQKEELQVKCKELQEKVDLFSKVDTKLEDRPKTGYRRVTRQSSCGVLRERSSNSNRAGTLSIAVPPLPSPRCTTPSSDKSETTKVSMPTTPRTPLANIFKWSLNSVGNSSFDGQRGNDEDGDMTLDEIMVSV